MGEISFKPADVGTVSDGSITDAKIASGGLSQSSIADLITALNAKISGTGTTANKKVYKMGWDSVNEKVVIDKEE